LIRAKEFHVQREDAAFVLYRDRGAAGTKARTIHRLRGALPHASGQMPEMRFAIEFLRKLEESEEVEPLSPWLGIAGGVLIGGAAAALLLLAGRIAGVSGILASALGIVKDAAPWKQAAAFIVGLPIGALLIALFIREPRVEFTSSITLLVVAGLLVGFGTRLANGCTSGHGVCGVARVSRRSLFATCTFMLTAIATVFLARHVFGA
jgi:uncharacterized protein